MYTKQEDEMTENNLYAQVIWNTIKCPGAPWAFSTGIKRHLSIRRAVSVTVCPVLLETLSEMPQKSVEVTSVRGTYNEGE